MEAYLRRGVYLCFVDEGAVFLDTQANAYLGIDASTASALRGSLAGLAPGSDSPVAGHFDAAGGVAELARRGVLTVSRSMGHPFSPVSVTLRRSLPVGTGRSPVIRVRASHVAWLVVALIPVSVRLRCGHLAGVIARLMTLKARVSGSSEGDWSELINLVHIFRRLTPLFYSSKDACLLDSAVLAEFLVRHGYRPVLVLGVRTKPFLAHAWVQAGDCVLNDSIEHAQTLTPIAAL